MTSTDICKLFLSNEFINHEFFMEIAERKLDLCRNQFKLRLVVLEPTIGKSENFKSVVYRARLSIEINDTKVKHLVDVVIKAALTKLEMTQELAIFDRECLMYKDVIGSFEKLFQKRAGETVAFGPQLVKIFTEPIEMIVLEDLKADGYELFDRKIGLDLDQAKLVLTKLAKFHAASAVRYQKDQSINILLDHLALLEDTNINTPELFIKDSQVFCKMFKRLIETISKIDGLEKIAMKLHDYDFLRLRCIFIATAEPMQNGFIVLNHGDNWVNNLMFKCDQSKQLSDVKFIDFQLSFWGSPANDLIYFLVSSVRDEIKIDNFDDLIQHYHEELICNLKRLSFCHPIPTLYELQMDILQKGGAFFFHMMLIMFFAKYNSCQELCWQTLADILDPSKGDSNELDKTFQNPIYIKALSTWLPFLDKRGYLDTFLPNAPLTPLMEKIFTKIKAYTPVECEINCQ